MAKSNFKEIKLTPTEELRPIEVYFKRLDDTHQNPTNRLLAWLCVPLLVFGLFGIAWGLPFPNLQFMGPYNVYFNWASFFIAFAVYFYLKLSPLLSYFFLFVLMVFSYGVMRLAGWQQAGGIPLWILSCLITLFALGGLYIGSQMEAKRQSLKTTAELVLVSPLWVLYTALKRFKIKY
ncbi:hypothetical protein FFF34_001305 [Inquilinus sp. KBS0705]|nr:hypothetical protein FFF34_001305 [Inquilinus sp. KBS0705]